MLPDKLFFTISEQIVYQIKSDIFSGKLKEGMSLKEAPMAEKYHVSRGPVRDAFKLLGKEGFLISKPNVGVTVAACPSDEIIHEIIILRRQVELFAFEKAFDKYTDEDFKKMEYVISRMKEASFSKNLLEFYNYDVCFHRVLIKRYDDGHFYGIWKELIFRMLFNYNRLVNLDASCAEHEEILKMIKNKKLKEAKSLLKANIQ